MDCLIRFYIVILFVFFVFFFLGGGGLGGFLVSFFFFFFLFFFFVVVVVFTIIPVCSGSVNIQRWKRPLQQIMDESIQPDISKTAKFRTWHIPAMKHHISLRLFAVWPVDCEQRRHIGLRKYAGWSESSAQATLFVLMRPIDCFMWHFLYWL